MLEPHKVIYNLLLYDGKMSKSKDSSAQAKVKVSVSRNQTGLLAAGCTAVCLLQYLMHRVQLRDILEISNFSLDTVDLFEFTLVLL